MGSTPASKSHCGIYLRNLLVTIQLSVCLTKGDAGASAAPVPQPQRSQLSAGSIVATPLHGEIAPVTDVHTFAKAVREHWGIEASLHHVLDVSFLEDVSRIHKDHAADNLAVIRHFALNALSFLDVGKKNVSARRKRKMCGRNPQLLLLALDKILSPKPAS